MKIVRLIWRETWHRKVGFALAVASVAAASACLTGALGGLRIDARVTEQILAGKREAVRLAGAELEDAVRRITLGLGFNLLILPADQDAGELHLDGTLSRTMPESQVNRLAQSGIVSINHLLPTVLRRIRWPEQGFSIILQGTRGEVPLLHADPKQPLLDAVPRGAMVLGAQIQRRLQAQPGDRVTLMGREFRIDRVLEERGTADDLTVWIHLREAQELLGLENLIHAILALECRCADGHLEGIRKEIAGILPGTQVIERGPAALARAEARSKAKDAAVQALELETATRLELRLQQERVARRLVPGVLVAVMVWVGLLAFTNVRDRRAEIGILHALGFRSPGILAVFLGKWLVIGAVGGLAGTVIGTLGALWLKPDWQSLSGLGHVLGPAMLTGCGVAMALSLAGSWLPAVWAARLDPAELLQDQ
ncbi:MAG: FtsX-like permease family protein [Verrucomicrobiales bacterium]|nr:FtsX-like permease family protein [Verrucomicrobiales bacterium]